MSDVQRAPSVVGRYLDQARVRRPHLKQLALLGGGGFFDAFDIYLSGSVLAAMLAAKFSTVGENATFLSATSFGLLVGTLIAGYLGDRFGRRSTYLYALALYSAATLVTSFAPSHGLIVALRVATGLGLGAVLITGYGTWNEFVPSRRRASWAGVLAMIVNLALPASAIAGLLVIPSLGWRAMFIVCGVPAVLIWLLQMKFLDESPRWLESRGRHEEAYRIARRYNPDMPEQPESFPAPAGKTERPDFRALFRKPLGRITAACILIAVCNQIAFYTFQSWVPTYLVGQGLSVQKSLGITVLMQLGAVPGCLIGGLVGDRLGRKWVNAALFVLMGGVGMWYGYSSSTAELIVAGIIWVFLASFAISVQIASYIPELFPTELRLQGSSLANAFARGSVIVTPFLVSSIYGSVGVQGVFLGVLGVCLVGAIAVIVLAPETRQRSLEDIAEGTVGHVAAEELERKA
ncbi:MFS transporter [Amycolatopsis sp. K13G38]|uniref:MFS transporter n=1 Tax=Amycolatopsis acididurans TaxID=2724524 RepID=A0ABX1IWS5_9PSEU|nr:MFS transporter [Amycolatopsis acididurans]NKQ51779.1 MFS transporter [Amycolatopsis acididurans]